MHNGTVMNLNRVIVSLQPGRILHLRTRARVDIHEHPRRLPRPYNGFMITRGIRELVARDWEAARENKQIYWRERIGRLGATEGFRIAEELRRQMRRCDPHWPDAETRQVDLRFHASMAERFRRAGAARRG